MPRRSSSTTLVPVAAFCCCNSSLPFTHTLLPLLRLQLLRLHLQDLVAQRRRLALLAGQVRPLHLSLVRHRTTRSTTTSTATSTTPAASRGGGATGGVVLAQLGELRARVGGDVRLLTQQPTGDQGVCGTGQGGLRELSVVAVRDAVDDILDGSRSANADFGRDAGVLWIMRNEWHYFSTELLLNVLNEGAETETEQCRFCVKLRITRRSFAHCISRTHHSLAVLGGNKRDENRVESQR